MHAKQNEAPAPPEHEIGSPAGCGVRKLALVFDDQTRPETTGVYCRRALARLVEQVDVFRPSQLAELPRAGYGLYLNIDDGLRYEWPGDLRPSAFWCIDTHIDFDWSLHKARGFDRVFVAQRNGGERLRRSGVSTTAWLPLACDPETHRRHELPKTCDVCFVGHLAPGSRTELVRLIQRNFRDVFVGLAYFDEMAQLYSSTRIVFNRSVADDVNMRVFEALATGSLLMTNDLTGNGQAELFRDGVHLATYRDADELLDKLRYYLAHDRLREQIAAAGRAEVLANHTYEHRMRQLLASVASTLRDANTAGNLAARSVPGSKLPVPISEPGNRNQEPGTLPADPSYFEHARPELVSLVPASARRVLDVGCGAGRLGESLKARQACDVIGIELDARAAIAARERLDQVLTGDVEQLPLDFPESRFDGIICGDVLEHLRDPGALLDRLRPLLAVGGVLVASLPNVRHHSVVRSLIEGNWTYEPAGLLDQTHLHFFDRRGVERMFLAAGYQITNLAAVPGPGHEQWEQLGRLGRVQLGRLTLENLSPDEAEEFFIYQWLVVAEPKSPRPEVQTSKSERATLDRGPSSLESLADPQSAIRNPRSPQSLIRVPHALSYPRCLLLMVTYNRLEYTRLALEAVLALDYPGMLEIVVWDNASTDGTLEYLRQRLAGLPHARCLAQPENHGIVRPMNEVWWSRPQAELLAKVDNDTLVPADWLRRMADCHAQSTRWGVLSGFHFRREGERLADETRLASFDGACVLPQPYVGGCAVVVRRAVLERSGSIPCRRAAQTGPFMDSGWTAYQQRIAALGWINGYPWPLLHVDHMEDTRSPHCIRCDEHEAYKRALRGMNLDEFTEELCVWRPNWSAAGV